MLEESNEKDVYSEESKLVFPPFKVKFQSHAWNWRVCRDLVRYFEILGFSRNGPKHFRKPQFCPTWFPDGVDWSEFSTGAKMHVCTSLYDNMLYYGQL